MCCLTDEDGGSPSVSDWSSGKKMRRERICDGASRPSSDYYPGENQDGRRSSSQTSKETPFLQHDANAFPGSGRGQHTVYGPKTSMATKGNMFLSESSYVDTSIIADPKPKRPLMDAMLDTSADSAFDFHGKSPLRVTVFPRALSVATSPNREAMENLNIRFAEMDSVGFEGCEADLPCFPSSSQSRSASMIMIDHFDQEVLLLLFALQALGCFQLTNCCNSTT